MKGYDYTLPGGYFVTICTHNRDNIFGEIMGGEMRVNEFGQIAHDQWYKIPARFACIEMDAFLVMPNHIHGILIITDVGAGLAPTPNTGFAHANGAGANGAGANGAGANGAGASPAPTDTLGLPAIVGAYKSLVANECLEIHKSRNSFMGKLWQRNYYEHIIRGNDDLYRIRDYILGNPENWGSDSENSDGNKREMNLPSLDLD